MIEENNFVGICYNHNCIVHDRCIHGAGMLECKQLKLMPSITSKEVLHCKTCKCRCADAHSISLK